MRAVSKLGERAARLAAGPSNPHCNAGMSFTILRDAAPLPRGPGARRFFRERLAELAAATARIQPADARSASAARLLADLAKRGERGFTAVDMDAKPPSSTAPSRLDASMPTSSFAAPAGAPTAATRTTGKPPTPVVVNGIEEIEGDKLAVLYEGKKCIHSRFCVTWGPNVFLANVQGPWIDPNAMDAERVAEIAHACPSGAIRYRRKDGRPDETAPPVNLIAVREAGPYAVRADLLLDGERVGFRATLCRCGASKNKPFCDGSHHAVSFAATGEPPTGPTAMLPRRDGELAIDPEIDGPLRVRGNLEITSGTGRAVARVTQAKLCRCGGSSTKPFCDGTHARIGFRSS
jgi:CDGSH-type Zn-finger protein/uncharacterized Fe-S cluster protein YjdI